MKVIRVDHATTTGTMETADVEVTDEQYERIVSVANSEGSCGYKSPHGRMVSSVAAAKLSDREVALVLTGSRKNP